MSVQRLAARYAKSLFDVAKEQNELETVQQDMLGLFNLAKSSKDLRMLLQSPIIRPERKYVIFQEIFKDKLHNITNQFFQIIMRKHREPYIIEICKQFTMMYNKENKISTVKLTTAHPLSDEALNAVRAQLVQSNALENNVELEVAQDESLLGGFTLEFENQLYDASVAHQLDKLKKSFTKNTYTKNL